MYGFGLLVTAVLSWLYGYSCALRNQSIDDFSNHTKKEDVNKALREYWRSNPPGDDEIKNPYSFFNKHCRGEYD